MKTLETLSPLIGAFVSFTITGWWVFVQYL